MNIRVQKNIFSRGKIMLILFGLSFFAAGFVSAQSINVVPAGADNDIRITAQVLGCGDLMVQTGIGEQCDGTDLNGQTCESLGFESGSLSCRSSCIFDTSACTNNDGNNSGSKIRDVSAVFGNQVPDTNLVFTGRGEPGSIFFVIANNEYLTSAIIDDDGNFSVTYSDPIPGEYSFQFYALTDLGLMGPNNFSTGVPAYATTYINNILLPLVISKQAPPEPDIPDSLGATVDEENLIVPKQDIFEAFLQVLEKQHDLSPQELSAIIQSFAEYHGYNAQIPEYRNSWNWPLFQSWLSQKTAGLSEWYPNVYFSFLVPYWNVVYDASDWFNEYRAPWWGYRFFLKNP